MKNLLSYSVLAVLIIVTAMTGCKKDDNGNGAEKTALLTAHIWKYYNFTTTSTDPHVQQAAAEIADEYTGASINLNSDGTYTYSQHGATDSGTWELNADETKLITDKGTDDETEHSIITLTSDVFENTWTEDFNFLGLVEVTLRWVK